MSFVREHFDQYVVKDEPQQVAAYLLVRGEEADAQVNFTFNGSAWCNYDAGSGFLEIEDIDEDAQTVTLIVSPQEVDGYDSAFAKTCIRDRDNDVEVYGFGGDYNEEVFSDSVAGMSPLGWLEQYHEDVLHEAWEQLVNSDRAMDSDLRKAVIEHLYDGPEREEYATRSVPFNGSLLHTMFIERCLDGVDVYPSLQLDNAFTRDYSCIDMEPLKIVIDFNED